MLGKPWTKHKCYYEVVQVYFEDEIDLTLENLPELLTEKINFNTNLIHIEPKIKQRLLKNHLVIEFSNIKQNCNLEFIIKYDKLEFGLCFYNKDENTIEGYLNDESYSLNCYEYEQAKIELKDIFPYEIGEKTVIEIFKDNIDKDILTVYYRLTVKNFVKRPEAFMKIKNMKPDTLSKLYNSNGLKISVCSKLNMDKSIEFIEIE